MSAGTLAGQVIVPFFGALMCITPAITRPTVPFGVRVPAERARATVIRRERHAYYWRTAPVDRADADRLPLPPGYRSH
jgi:hypothetical protein